MYDISPDDADSSTKVDLSRRVIRLATTLREVSQSFQTVLAGIRLRQGVHLYV